MITEMKNENSVLAWKDVKAVLWMDMVTRLRNNRVLRIRDYFNRYLQLRTNLLSLCAGVRGLVQLVMRRMLENKLRRVNRESIAERGDIVNYVKCS